ncbi:MAG: glycosyltransferase family 2 protein [Actinomycetota bacterium]
MNVSVVIPTLDGGRMLLDCLSSFGADRDDIEVILVDNASSDGSVDQALERFPRIKVLRNEINRGYAPACNQGAGAATQEFVLFLNNDASLDRSQLDRMLEVASGDGQTAIWQPVTYGIDGSLEATGDHFTWWGIFQHLDAPPASSGATEVFSTVGAALLVRRDAFAALGGFEDSYFAYYEESDLCWRARLAGWDVKVIADARVSHIGSSTTGSVFEPHAVRYLAFRNRIRTNLSTPQRSSLWRIAPLHAIACLGFVLFYLVTGRPRSSASVLQAMWWSVGNRDVLAEQRRRTQALRQRSDREIFRRDLVTSFGPREIWRHLKRSYWFERASDRVSDSRRRT